MRKKAIIIAGILVLVLIYLAGPAPSKPDYDTTLPDLPSGGLALETYVEVTEGRLPVKPENKAEIIWADPVNRTRTPYAIVYLHGFSASQREGFPTHRMFAERYGCNLYLARLHEHGLYTDDALMGLTAEGLWKSALEAYAIGRNLGDKVIIMSTSTGGTLALALAARFPEIAGLINLSPNIEINDPSAFFLNNPWGLQVARLVIGSNYREVPSDENYRKYWYHRYRIEALPQLQELIESTCSKSYFEQVHCPVFNGYYFSDKNSQDPVVRVSAIQRMHRQLGTPYSLKVEKAFPNAGNHVIGCDLLSGSIPELFDAICQFAEEKMGMIPIDNSPK